MVPANLVFKGLMVSARLVNNLSRDTVARRLL